MAQLMSVKLLHGWKTMSHNIPLLVLASPLLAALAVNLFGSFSRKIIPAIVEASLAASFCGALCVLSDVIRHGAYTYTVGGWRAPYGIELVVDPLAAVMLVLVSLVGLLSSGVAVPTVFKSMPNKTHLFFALYLVPETLWSVREADGTWTINGKSKKLAPLFKEQFDRAVKGKEAAK